MDLAVPNAHDARQLEILAEPLAVDTTLMSPIRGNGSTRPGAADTDEIALAQARRKKERTFPELVLVARAKARSEPLILRGRVEQAWRMRWAATLACSAARAFAASLLGFRVGGGADGNVPWAHEVVNDHRHEGLG